MVTYIIGFSNGLSTHVEKIKIDVISSYDVNFTLYERLP